MPDGEVADHFGDLEDVAGLELVAVVLVAPAPVLGHLRGVAVQHRQHIIDHIRGDDLAQARTVGGVDRDHDGHVVVQDLDGEVLAQLTADFHVLDLHDLARAMMRVDDLIADSVQDQPPPGRSCSGWRPRLCVGRRQGPGDRVPETGETHHRGSATQSPGVGLRHEHGLEAHLRGFGDPPLRLPGRPQLPGEADLAEHRGVARQRDAAFGGGHCESHGQIGRRFFDAHPADYVNKNVGTCQSEAAVTAEDGHDHGQTVAIETGRQAARQGQIGGVDQRLYLDEKAARAFDRDVHARAGRAALGEEDGGRVGDGLEPALAHLEDSELVRGAEAVLDGAQQAEEAVAVALELQHGVDHVLEHPRSGDGAVFGDVPDQEHGGAALFGQAQEPRGRLAHLTDAAGRRREVVAVEGLHRVDHDQRRAALLEHLEDRLELGLGQHLDDARGGADALGPHLDLGRRLLAADEHDRAVAAGGADRVEHLQQQRGLADPGLAADEHERARDDAAAEHAVELGDAAGEALVGRRGEVGEGTHGGGAAVAPGNMAAGGGGSAAPARRRALQAFFGEGVPGPAVGAASEPARLLVATLATGEDDVVLAHHPGRRPRLTLAGDFGERGLAVAGRRRRVVGRRPDEGFVDAEQ